MTGALTISAKELKTLVKSPNFYVIGLFLTIIFSVFFSASLSQFFQNSMMAMMSPQGGGQNANIHYAVFLRHLSYLNLLLIFVTPAITMKLFAEEKKLHTFDLLLTSPVTSTEIVIGKYLAAIGALFIFVLIALLYPISTVTFAKIQWAPLLIAFFGIFLVAAVYAAMNLFASSLTESILISYVISVILNVSIWFVGIGVEMVDSPTARQFFEHISLNYHLSGLVEGTIRTSSLIFLFSVIGLFVFLCERVVESHRWR